MAQALSSGVIEAIVSGRHADPFAVLGLHETAGGFALRALVPGAESVDALTRDGAPLAKLARVHPAGFFEGGLAGRESYVLHARRGEVAWTFEDPYAFGPVLGPMDDWLIGEGTHAQLYERLGAHTMTHEGAHGVHFAVWAPNAQRASVVGDFNDWDGRRHVMRRRVDNGVWEIFVPGLGEGAHYKYEIIGAGGELLPLKADPVGFGAQLRPADCSVVREIAQFPWSDQQWMAARAARNPRRAAMAIYELHTGSWRRGEANRWLDWDEIATALLPYVTWMGFTHVELMPVNEHPLDASWGYQPIGLFAPTARHGEPAGFARFVDRCHAAGIGVILDWVPAHFPLDPHGLAWFDGTALYEHADPRKGVHPDWSTAIYNYGRPEVANYLIANALFWLERYHVDGLRVDAVASMLYLDYSRKPGEWIANPQGGNENLEAVAFLRRLNEAVYARHPGAITIAEESTTWPGVSHPTWSKGLGFGFKWNLGWMHDTLAFLREDPAHRRSHHERITFGLLYTFAENYVLPLSHDEVVHGKGSLLARMPGEDWQRFATLRAYYAFMWAYPGKKLIFMGQEFAQGREWNFEAALDWDLTGIDWHHGVQALVRDCNHAYRAHRALHERDCEAAGFRWIVVDDKAASVFAWLREAEDVPPVAVIANLTPMPRKGYRIGLPLAGRWREILNSDAGAYRGSNVGNAGSVLAAGEGAHGQPHSAAIDLPPLATLWLVHEGH